MQTPFELLVIAVNTQYNICKGGSKPDKELNELTVKLLERVNKDLYAENTYEPSTGIETRMEDLEEYITDLDDTDVEDDKDDKDDVEEIEPEEEPD